MPFHGGRALNRALFGTQAEPGRTGMKTVLAFVVAVCLFASIPAHAQTDLGSLRGYIKDEQGGVLPGVTVTATGPQILAPVIAVTDADGYYRVLNLPPGAVVLTAELAGFAPYRREGIVMRAGSTFSIDIEMRVGGLAETVTVKAESPMIETLKASSSFTISGELVRATPITSRGIFTDTVDMVPGVGSRQANDGSGIRIYYFMGSSQLASYTALEGAQFGGFANPAPARTSMSTETIMDTELRTGGAEPSTPLTMGLYLNVVAPQGGNAFKGAAGFTLQPMAWNANNSSGGRVPGGLPKPEGVRQVDLSLGGPIVKDKAWFFSTFRWASDTNGISRTPLDLANLTAFRPGFEPFDNTWGVAANPFVKVTTQLNPNHVLSTFYIYDRAQYTSFQANDADKLIFQSGGGSLAQARLNSLWGEHTTSTVSLAYSNKGNAGQDTYKNLIGSGPQVLITKDIFLSSGLPTTTGTLVRMNNTQSKNFSPSSAVYFQGNVTYFKEGWAGSHEFKAGLDAAPASHYDVTNEYVNDGFVLQEDRQIDPSNPAAGTTWYRRQYITPSTVHTVSARDKDIAVYAQDSWKPHARITATFGVRVDWVRRYDAIFNLQRMKGTSIGPRFGLSYLVTKDAKNVLRFFAGRIADQMAGSDVVESFATISPVTIRDVYLDKTGAQTTVTTNPPSAALAALQFAKNLHQPYVDEFILGYRKQFPGQFSLDVSGRRRIFKDAYGLVDINGIYPSGPNQPFGGFGLVDPTRGIVYQEVNNTWSSEVVTALEVVLAKNLSHNFQAMMSLSRQWQHIAGTWNPTDPARFIQPNAFANDRILPSSSGNNDNNSLDGTGPTPTFAGWRPYSLRLAGSYLAPWGVTLAGSYEVSSGDYLGVVYTRLAAADPTFGPSTVTLANGTKQANPLATTIRINFPTRGEGQTLNEPTRALQLKIGREFKLGRSAVTPSLNIYNLLNSGANTQYATGANQLYNTAYLSATNRMPARAFQFMAMWRF
ncbi:MAG: carboxypeptidase regulatory-like domain-containing protein [Acidobacteria bacterium]|nr:carboxypeptidase regulatory-like domain-containing protein [Acidobacteriota bacterium]